jgi:hypothetical protein
MIPVVFCPWCLIYLIVLSVVVLPILAFLGKVCKIRWAGRAYDWCIARIESLKFWKKKEEKEEEQPSCKCEGCNCERRKDD